jgi:outer membrane protein assembly factor BamB
MSTGKSGNRELLCLFRARRGERVVYVGSDVGIWALNASTGALLWSYAAGEDVSSAPAVADGVVYAGSSEKVL